MNEQSVPVDDATMQRWTELALSIRTAVHTVANVAIPLKGSAFAMVDDLFPAESVSQWAREGLRSSVDHLIMWANHAVPLQLFDGQVVTHQGFRWSFTLMRSAIEGASQSLWLSRSPDPGVCLARLIRMVRHDLREERLACIALGRNVTLIEERATRHETAAQSLTGHGTAVSSLPSMIDLVRLAAEAASLDPAQQEANWRICSAAAHGKDWAIRELQVLGNPVEWRPGQFHLSGHPDPQKLTRILEDAVTLLSAGVIEYLVKSGVNPIKESRRSMLKAARETPQKDGGIHVEYVALRFETDNI
ncbi:hypothetical protein [Cryobacterium sp. TMT2-42-4]|uniref:hypothetical protein n=1 Tax=Cryobacterium sp. TMT2-42-4 TaxID=1259255 RepID=UPI00106D530C|nr:hypothetical protein [Cryobacterium sp. TMT2-42-4]TFC40264.1 hypothetical protein E3O18_00050 [Cryobacterium sp. TMT2-42-4]